ncbi:MAG: transaldolase [Candidatus Wallbacteria bacterium]|nr:transaldolase [Candidatus Wallbacteria bacterium]
MKVKIFADGADLAGIQAMYAKPWIRGFTTNPTLMRKAGVADYRAFARDVLRLVPDRPVSFEVFSDEFDEMEAQAFELASWGPNVNVKIPVTNARRQSSLLVIQRLSKAGVALNITAVMTVAQVAAIAEQLAADTPAIVSVFAGRIADTGADPMPIMREAKRVLRTRPRAELLWASPREVLNLVQADEVECDIITATNDILAKVPLFGKNHSDYSLETVQMFHRDAMAAGYTIPLTNKVRGEAAGPGPFARGPLNSGETDTTK